MEESKSKAKHGYALYIIGTIAVIIAFCVLTFYWSYFSGGFSNKHNVWAEFGDFIGGVLNPVFGFLGLIAILITVSLQASELALTRDELRRSSEALESQNETFLKQSFENSFFQMLHLHNDIVTSMELHQHRNHHKGRDCFVACWRKLTEDLDYYERGAEENIGVEAVYEEFYNNYKKNLGHYFRYLYNLLKFVHNSSISDKKFYTNLIRAQLSDHELVIIFYNCLSKYGKDKFLPLAIEYDLFDNMPDSLLGNIKHLELLKSI